MSKESLQPLIVAEILRRRKQREEERLKKEAAAREEVRQIFLTTFEEALDDCVRNLKDFESYKLPKSAVDVVKYHSNYYYEEAKKLHLDVDCNYSITYKEMKNDEFLTDADHLFFIFKQKLDDARKLRLLDIKQECHHVKQSILDGNYHEYIAYYDQDNCPHFSIRVPANFPLMTDKERNAVAKFFLPFDLCYRQDHGGETYKKDGFYHWNFRIGIVDM